MALTEVAIRNAKPKTKPYKLSDAGVTDNHLLESAIRRDGRFAIRRATNYDH